MNNIILAAIPLFQTRPDLRHVPSDGTIILVLVGIVLGLYMLASGQLGDMVKGMFVDYADEPHPRGVISLILIVVLVLWLIGQCNAAGG